MKTTLIYSGKGGVGKTTTTANIARALIEKGNKVFIIDGDINTPSMSVCFPNQHPEENLMIHSTGFIFESMIYFEKSMVRRFINDGLQLVKEFKPDVILIDTPPSITDVHIEIIETLKISTIILVTQPNNLSLSDVIRTSKFFSERCKEAPVYIVENMSFGELKDSPLPIKAVIQFEEKMRGDLLYDKHPDTYRYIAELCLASEPVEQNIQENIMFDESYEITNIRRVQMGSASKRGYYVDCDYGDGVSKTRFVKKLVFQNVRSWEYVSEYMMDELHFSPFPERDGLLRELTYERVARLVKAFENDKEAYFMITKAPNTDIVVFPGEIGRATMVVDDKFYGVPRLQYQTKHGNLILFTHEAIPVSMQDISNYIGEGYKVLPDGRYLPTPEHIEMIHDAFGSRVGLYDNWKKQYSDLYSYLELQPNENKD